jgi:hypothetical protein
MVKSEPEDIMKVGFRTTMEVQVSMLLRNLLGIMGFTALVYKWGRQHM